MIFRYLFLAALFLPCSVYAATPKTSSSNSETPKGKAIIQIFTNFHSGFGTKNDYRGFELDRSYLGYEHHLGHGLTVKGVMDIGKSSDVTDYERIAYIKNAMLSWKYKKLTIHGGLIPTTQFRYQEKFWGYRYIMKSNQDFYGFGSSADLGISAAYQFNNWLSADLILLNGEGYKKVQVSDGLLYGAGITLTPLEGLSIRAYASLNETSEEEEKDAFNFATFIGYGNELYSLGCEYNRIKHAKYVTGNHQQSVSVYGKMKLSKVVNMYARYDQLFVDHDAYKDKAEYALIGGAEFLVGKYIKLAPNFRYVHPTSNAQKGYCAAYINCSFGI